MSMSGRPVPSPLSLQTTFPRPGADSNTFGSSPSFASASATYRAAFSSPPGGLLVSIRMRFFRCSTASSL